MSNAKEGKLVSPYLRQPLRTYAEALADRRRRQAEDQAESQPEPWLRRPAANVVPLERRRPIPPRLVVTRRSRDRSDAA